MKKSSEKQKGFLNRKSKAILASTVLAIAAVVSACSGGGSSSSSSSSSVGTNIFAKVASSGSGSILGVKSARRGRWQKQSTGLSGCTVNAYNLNNASTVVATGTTDSNGNVTLTGGSLTAGSIYKVISTCGTGSSATTLSSVVTADNNQPSAKTAADVDPITTVITAQVVKLIVTTIAKTIQSVMLGAGLPASAAQQVIAAFLSPAALAPLVANIANVVQQSIDTGAMAVPTAATATALASATTATVTIPSTGSSLAEIAADAAAAQTAATNATTAIATATTSYSSALTSANVPGTAVPAAVTSSVKAAAATAAAFPACDNTQNAAVANVKLCTQAVAEFMYNTVHFPVAIITDQNTIANQGAFGSGTTTDINCTTPSTSTALTTAFPDATFEDGTGPSGNGIPVGYCYITSTTPVVNRNQDVSQYNSGGGGGGGGVTFMETCTAGLACAGSKGVLTELAANLYGLVPTGGSAVVQTKYYITDLDKVVFGYDAATGGGMNGRLIYPTNVYNFNSAPGNNGSQYYTTYQTLAAGTPNTLNSLSTAAQAQLDTACTTSSSAPHCQLWDINTYGMTNQDWTTATGYSTSTAVSSSYNLVAQAINGSAFTGSVFANKFGGAIPDLSSLSANITDATTHADWNRTGQPKFNVLYSEQPDWNNPNCQWGDSSVATSYTLPSGTTTLKCSGQTTGTNEPTVRVDIITGAADTTTGLSQITTINTSATGAYYVYAEGSSSNILQFVNVSTGSVMLDEAFNPRSVFVIVNDTADCTTLGSGAPSGCGSGNHGQMFNVGSSWSCTSSGPCLPVVTQTAAQISQAQIAGTFSLNPKFQPNIIWSSGTPLNYVAAGSSTGWVSQFTKIITVKPASDGSIPTANIQLAHASAGPASNYYSIQPRMVCTGTPPSQTCAPSGYILVDSTGNIYSAAVSGGTSPNNYFQDTATADQMWSPMIGGPSITPTQVSPVVYTDGYFSSLGSHFQYVEGTSGGWKSVAGFQNVPQGPASNPNYDCSLDPYFVDTFNDGTIHFTVNSVIGVVTCDSNQRTFNDFYSAQQYVFGNPNNTTAFPAHALAVIALNNKNSYVFGDPKSGISLMTTAFGPWLDGTHTLTTTTPLNSLQGLSLMFMLLSNGGDITHIPGILPNASNGRPQDGLQILMGACGGNGNGLLCNSAIAAGFNKFNQNNPH